MSKPNKKQQLTQKTHYNYISSLLLKTHYKPRTKVYKYPSKGEYCFPLESAHFFNDISLSCPLYPREVLPASSNSAVFLSYLPPFRPLTPSFFLPDLLSLSPNSPLNSYPGSLSSFQEHALFLAVLGASLSSRPLIPPLHLHQIKSSL